jgi:hypothetical protein
MLAVTKLTELDMIDIYQCPEGKSAVVYLDLFFDDPYFFYNYTVEIDIAIWDNGIQDYIIFTYWRGTGRFVSLGPIWLNSKDKIQGYIWTGEGVVNCFVHGVEF